MAKTKKPTTPKLFKELLINDVIWMYDPNDNKIIERLVVELRRLRCTSSNDELNNMKVVHHRMSFASNGTLYESLNSRTEVELPRESDVWTDKWKGVILSTSKEALVSKVMARMEELTSQLS